MAVDLASLQRLYPTWGLVDAISAPNGGIWAVGRDGGVFSLNASGGTDGNTAPFFGSYPALDPAARQGDRYFVGIQSDPETGGYTLISNLEGQNYRFTGDKPLGGAVDEGALGAPTAAPTYNDADLNQLRSILEANGLGALVDEAWNYYKDPKGAAGDSIAVLNWLPTTQTYQARFPGLKEMSDKGMAMKPSEWNIYFENAQEQAVAAGLPVGYLDRADVGKLLVGGVSPLELQNRIMAAGASVYNADPMVIAQMKAFGFTDGDLTAFFLDPDKATPLLERKAQEGQARIGAAATRTSFGTLSLTEAQGLQKLGVDEAEAEQGFGTLAKSHALFQNMIGEEGEITRQEQLGATFGNDAAAEQEIATRRARRSAQFQGGGGAASGGAGKQGLGGAG